MGFGDLKSLLVSFLGSVSTWFWVYVMQVSINCLRRRLVVVGSKVGSRPGVTGLGGVQRWNTSLLWQTECIVMVEGAKSRDKEIEGRFSLSSKHADWSIK